jgi:transposase
MNLGGKGRPSRVMGWSGCAVPWWRRSAPAPPSRRGRDFAAWLVPKQISTGDRTILGPISRRGNRYLRVLFAQAAWVVLVRPKSWEHYGLKAWIEAAKRRLHHNVLAIALANKLARIAWAVLARGRDFEVTRSHDRSPQPA